MEKLRERFEGLPRLGPFSDEEVIQDLGDGLVLRHATPGDVEALAAFNAIVHSPSKPALHLGAWTRDLAGGEHPYVSARDFSVVEDTRGGRVASTLALLSHRLRYAGIELRAGQPELVGTHPDHRRRGLVALQMDEVHRWSAERGQVLQLITGIPWYYRQFGYELALENAAGRIAPQGFLPHGAPRGTRRVREASRDDVPLIVEAYERSAARSLVSCVRDPVYAAFELTRRGRGSKLSRVFKVLESEAGEPHAVFAHLPVVFNDVLTINLAETVGAGTWSEVAPWILHDLREAAEKLAPRTGANLAGLLFALSTEHPLYRAAGDALRDVRRPYAWYVRIPDLADFLERVSPVLEERLAASDLAGYSGPLELNRYRSGLRLVFERGALERIESWLPSTEERGHASLPDLTFLQLLLGFRSFAQLSDAYPDCRADARSTALLDALFPRRPSHLMPTD